MFIQCKIHGNDVISFPKGNENQVTHNNFLLQLLPWRHQQETFKVVRGDLVEHHLIVEWIV